MNPVVSVSTVLRNLFNFRRRASRSEYWWFFLITLPVGLALMVRFTWLLSWSFSFRFEIFFLLFSLVFVLPVIHLVVMPAVTVRRLHDTGRSARWLLIPCILILGWGAIMGVATLVESFSDDGWASVIFALLFGLVWAVVSLVGLMLLTIPLAQRGTTGPNRYGADPLRPELGNDPAPRPAQAYTYPPAADASMSTGSDLGQSQPPPEPEPEPVDRQFCTQCGGQLPPEARFCTACGTAA